MGLLTKAPTFRTKMVSKTSWVEARPSLLLETVSVPSLEEKGDTGAHPTAWQNKLVPRAYPPVGNRPPWDRTMCGCCFWPCLMS